jgi:hypothetical protein
MEIITRKCDLCGLEIDMVKEEKLHEIVFKAEKGRDIILYPGGVAALPDHMRTDTEDDFQEDAHHHAACYLIALSNAVSIMNGNPPAGIFTVNGAVVGIDTDPFHELDLYPEENIEITLIPPEDVLFNEAREGKQPEGVVLDESGDEGGDSGTAIYDEGDKG